MRRGWGGAVALGQMIGVVAGAPSVHEPLRWRPGGTWASQFRNGVALLSLCSAKRKRVCISSRSWRSAGWSWCAHETRGGSDRLLASRSTPRRCQNTSRMQRSVCSCSGKSGVRFLLLRRRRRRRRHQLAAASCPRRRHVPGLFCSLSPVLLTWTSHRPRFMHFLQVSAVSNPSRAHPAARAAAWRRLLLLPDGGGVAAACWVLHAGQLGLW